MNRKEENPTENHTPRTWLQNSIQNNKSMKKTQDYAQKPQENCTFMNSISVQGRLNLKQYTV
jgi:hypothetical protein